MVVTSTRKQMVRLIPKYHRTLPFSCVLLWALSTVSLSPSTPFRACRLDEKRSSVTAARWNASKNNAHFILFFERRTSDDNGFHLSFYELAH